MTGRLLRLCVEPKRYSKFTKISLTSNVSQLTTSNTAKAMATASTNDIFAQKNSLRKEMKRVLAQISREEKIDQSKRVTVKLLGDPVYVQAKSLSIYLSMDDEIQTIDILKNALESGKRCYIPRYFVGGVKEGMEMVLLKDMDDFEALPVTKWNIKQPPDDEIREELLDSTSTSLDLMLVPGLAFTAFGKRLGRGKGYYDKYLTKAESLGLRPLTTLALAFNEQIFEDIPTSENDFLIDRIISARSD